MSFCCFACRFQQRLQHLFVRVDTALHHAAAAAAASAALRAKKLHYRLQIEIRLRLQNEIAALAADKGERAGTSGKQTRRIAQGFRVGVKEGKRTFAYPVIIRAVNTTDAMTATVEDVPFALLQHITARITAEVENVNRVLYDLTPKPCATIEWE